MSFIALFVHIASKLYLIRNLEIITNGDTGRG